MSTTTPNAPKFRFLTTFALSAFLVFLVPVFSFFFFRYAQARLDSEMRWSILEQIRTDPKLTEEQRAKGIALVTEFPLSQLIVNQEVAVTLPSDTGFYYAIFRWMIILSAGSVVVGMAVFLLAAVCVAVSLHSQFVQHLSLSAGWHVLRIYGALQTVIQGILLVALSYWVPALWFHFYSGNVILCAGLVAVGGVGAVLTAIFQHVKDDFVVAGQVIAMDETAPLWNELRRICTQVGTHPPDQIIAGIDDNFFVTEHPVIVGDKTYRGRTLFVSLSLLKQLHGTEADAVLAHEMAHFSGQDTLYSRKIGPFLSRYNHYLQALHKGLFAPPVYYFMLSFRALFELSLGRMSRQREFRADRIAVELTSARAFAGALLRTVSYSMYRNGVERDLFQQERALEAANVCERVEQGFRRYAASFVAGPEIGRLAPAHPFDSHPPLAQRLRSIGMPLESADAQTLLATSGDGLWYQHVPAAQQMEKEQWRAYEERFRKYHEHSLPYRFLPASPEEYAIVVKSFPPLTVAGSEGVLSVDHEKMAYDRWSEPIRYAEITKLTLDKKKVLKIAYQRQGKRAESIKMKTFANQQAVLDAVNHYYGRYRAAVEYQQQKRQVVGSNDQPDRPA